MTGTPPPWQATYDRFRQLYPTGGLILDLAATPTAHSPQYVVKATAQVGHLTLLSVLGEAPHLLHAETEACQKLFQVLRLTETSADPVLDPRPSGQPLSQAIPEALAETLPGASPVAPPMDPPKKSKTGGKSPSKPLPATDLAERSFSEAQFPEPDLPERHLPEPELSRPEPISKSEPYRLVQPLGREEIMAPEVDDWSEELAQIEAELKRLGWTPQQESQYLQQRYGKLSRDHITDYGELLQFLTDLQGHPSPQAAPRGIEPWSPDGSAPPRSSFSSPPTSPPTASPPAASPIGTESGDTPSRQDMMDQVLAEIRRIGWTARQGSEYLQQNYQVKTRQELTNDQLQEFIIYLHYHP